MEGFGCEAPHSGTSTPRIPDWVGLGNTLSNARRHQRGRPPPSHRPPQAVEAPRPPASSLLPNPIETGAANPCPIGFAGASHPCLLQLGPRLLGDGSGDEANLKALLPPSKGIGLCPAAGTCLQGTTQAGECRLAKALSLKPVQFECV